MAASKRIITVFGATGAQGGAVASTFLHDAKLKAGWTVRAVTRDVTKPSATKLRDQGAEVIAVRNQPFHPTFLPCHDTNTTPQADMNNPSTLLEAMTGAYAVYAVTNYWESKDANVEMTQGKCLADAALTAGVQHYIWSSLLDMTKRKPPPFPPYFPSQT